MSRSPPRTQTPPWEAFASLLGDAKSRTHRWDEFGRHILMARHVHDVTDGAHGLVKLGRYGIRSILGRGGCGIVFEAHDPRLDRLVALKFCLASTSEAAADMEHEAKLQVQVFGPHVVTVHDVDWTEDEDVYVVMEYLDGGSVRGLIDSHTIPTWREVLAIYCDAGRGLAAAHEAGVRHGDFKPSNVLLDKHGRAKVGDFGLARVMAEHRPTRGVDEGWLPYGTPSYMPPETLHGKPGDARSDQWSFCVSVWETLDSEVPFPGLTRTTLLESIAKGPRVTNQEVPERVRDVLRVGLAVDPGERYPDMLSLVAELDRLLDETETPDRHTPEPVLGPLPEVEAEAPEDERPAVELLATRGRPGHGWARTLALGSVGGLLAISLVLAVYFEFESSKDSIPQLRAPGQLRTLHDWIIGVRMIGEAKIAVQRQELVKAYDTWQKGKDAIEFQTPCVAGFLSLDLAKEIALVDGEADQFFAGWIAAAAAISYEEAKMWNQASRARNLAAGYLDNANKDDMAAAQRQCAATNANGKRCVPPKTDGDGEPMADGGVQSAQPTVPSSFEYGEWHH